jgi:hypothetical protein
MWWPTTACRPAGIASKSYLQHGTTGRITPVGIHHGKQPRLRPMKFLARWLTPPHCLVSLLSCQ